MSKYAGKEIGRKERGQHALDTMTEDKKATAQASLDKLKKEYGKGTSTLSMIYNATGDTLTFAAKHDWHDTLHGPEPIGLILKSMQLAILPEVFWMEYMIN
ncbi:hypothetical protein FEM48_Zijuj07G0005000 [Ziziphus jujuba var. spinosa]|uniref:Uncharacterized protein n=1 Tax=Ziziphus jujuba var. spinosa TaxID=714518 RepID=A0A978V1D8_ZIZJJ|nr:hypothetical protein FEM48_Zijuj07G0005000 [Ziziphus jujuba var. spinosa]